MDMNKPKETERDRNGQKRLGTDRNKKKETK